MVNHTSARGREQTPHTIKSANRKLNGSATERRKTHETKSTGQEARAGGRSRKQGQRAGAGGRSRKTTISNALRRRARAVINDKSIDAQSRAIIRYSLETNDPWLPELVRRLDAGETIFETIVVLKRPKLTRRIPTGKRSKR